MKYLKITLFMFIFAAILCLTALAADSSGISDLIINDTSKTTITMYTATGTTPVEKSSDNVYPSAERFQITYNSAISGENYVIFVLNGKNTTEPPTQDNIFYIDQATADSSGTVTFNNVYPKNVTSGGTVYIAGGNTGLTELACYGYYKAEFKISIGNKTVQSGGTASVDLKISANPGIGATTLYLYYDTNYLTYDSFTPGSIWTIHKNSTNSNGTNSLYVNPKKENDMGNFDDGDGVNENILAISLVSEPLDLNTDGNLLTLNFKAAQVSQPVTTELSAICLKTTNNQQTQTNIPVLISNGAVTIRLYTLGDVDDDGFFTASDALITLKLSVGIDDFTNLDLKKLASNVDGDTFITASDALMILKRSVGIIDSFN